MVPEVIDYETHLSCSSSGGIVKHFCKLIYYFYFHGRHIELLPSSEEHTKGEFYSCEALSASIPRINYHYSGVTKIAVQNNLSHLSKVQSPLCRVLRTGNFCNIPFSIGLSKYGFGQSTLNLAMTRGQCLAYLVIPSDSLEGTCCCGAHYFMGYERDNLTF